jgi:hypothetical protein
MFGSLAQVGANWSTKQYVKPGTGVLDQRYPGGIEEAGCVGNCPKQAARVTVQTRRSANGFPGWWQLLALLPPIFWQPLLTGALDPNCQ